MSGAGPSFDVDRLIAECRAVLAETAAQSAVGEIVGRAVSDPGAVLRVLGTPARAGIQALHRSDDLTIINVIWAPRMTLMPHDHAMWAVIGIYSGREDNIFWRRVPGDTGGLIEAAGAKSLGTSDAIPLGRDVVHSVNNPTSRFTGAIHVYGGDFFTVERSEWDPETLRRQRFDVDKTLRLFEEANASAGMTPVSGDQRER